MTDQHPLTDEICDQIQDSVHPCDPENMRTAADWQLEQLIEWLKGNLGSCFYLEHYWDGVSEVDVDYVLKDLREAMRPTTQEGN